MRIPTTALALVLVAAATAQEPDRKLYVVGTAHLDTQWRWTIQKTITDYIPNTLRMNLDYMDRYPGYVFSFEGSIRYMLAKEYYPELYAKMKERIAEGRWRVTGSWIDATDVNLPSPEALIRQNLYGNGFFKQEFGKTSVDVFLPDCFGFGYALPSVAAHCGLKGFTTQKLLSYGSAYGGVPFNIGTWEGVDGSSIAAVLEPGRYRHDVGTDWTKADWLLKRIDDLGQKSGLYLDVRLHGTGDRGGGPTQRSMDNLAACMKTPGPIKVTSQGNDDLFRELQADQLAKLPHYNGELLMKAHGTGCYTSISSAKRWNRKNELLADAAEKAAVMASQLGSAYPQAKLNEAWTRFLWHGFHDDLPGTSIPEVYAFTWNDQILSLNQFAEVLTDSVKTVAARLDTRVKGVPVVVTSPLASPRRDVVRAELTFEGDAPPAVRVFAPGGGEVPAQVTVRHGSKATVLFQAETQGVEAAVYDVRPAPAPGRSALEATSRRLENERYAVEVNEAGDIASVYDKRGKRELLKSPIRYAFLKDKPGRYPAWEVVYEDVSSAPVAYLSGPARIRCVERGPARVALAVERQAPGGARITQTVSLAAGSDRVEVDFQADWRSRGMMLKAEFHPTCTNPKATYDLGLGVIARGNNSPQLYEVPAQQWADVTAADGSYGVSILSESKYGWDKPDDGTLRLTLLRTPDAGDKDHQSSNDFGRHAFSFAVYGHQGDWRNGSADQGERFNQPLRAFQAGQSGGGTDRRLCLLRSVTPGVSVKAFKKAEEGDDWVVRVFETTGRPLAGARLQFGSEVVSVREADGFETPLPAATLPVVTVGKDLVFTMKPFRPRTFLVSLAASKPVVAVASEAVPLACDTDLVARQGEPGGFIPAELWPSSIRAEGVAFNLSPADGPNALTCRGQTVRLPEANRVILLAASTERDAHGLFKIGGKVVGAAVPNAGGWIGQWDSRVRNGKWDRDLSKMTPAFIKRTPVAWVGTHRHDAAGKDLPYEFCYLFKVVLEVPKGSQSIILPKDGRIKVFAVTAVRDPRPALAPAGALYE